MEKPTISNNEVLDKGQGEIYLGIAIIILSPLLGSLLFVLYVNVVGKMISTDGAVEMFWLSCILAMTILGITTVLIGCNKKVIEHRGSING